MLCFRRNVALQSSNIRTAQKNRIRWSEGRPGKGMWMPVWKLFAWAIIRSIILCVCPFVVFLHLAVTSLGLGCYGCHRFSDRRRCRAQQLFHRRAGNTSIVCNTGRCLPTYTDNCPGKIDAKNILFTYLNEVLWKGRRKFNYKDNYQILAVYSR